MSFVVLAALAIALLVGAPFVAHLLRRGRAREQDFPPAALVPSVPPVARQRSRLEDRLLLAVRAALIVALALLGATPLIRCSRLSLARSSGASVAIVIVLDDSLSMRASIDGQTRFERALAGARELASSARSGDAVALVLAGKPARLLLAATTDLGAARVALEDLEPTDRATDLEAAVQIARSALKSLPHVDKRVAVLSDLAGPPLPAGEPPVWAPLELLQRSVDDCGIVAAEQRGRQVSARLACSSPAAAAERTLELVLPERSAGQNSSDAAPPAPQGGPLGSAKLTAQGGLQTVSIELSAPFAVLDARLSGRDAIAEDDLAPVAPQAHALGLAVVSDPTTSAVTTGGTTVLEQAFGALGAELLLRPLPVLPDNLKELGGFALIVLDDPAGLTPEARSALDVWLERGGVGAALLGPHATSVQLGETLEPFAQGAVRWENTEVSGVEPASLSWLGSEASSMAELKPRSRALLAGAEPAGARVTARWVDGQPFIVERTLGRGLSFVVSLPASVDHSDFALRPGFLALLEHLVDEAVRRSGPRRSVAGESWSFMQSVPVEVSGPEGSLEVREIGVPGTAEKQVVPELVGRYELRVGGEPQTRIVTLDGREITDAPRPLDAAVAERARAAAPTQIDASREVALLVLGLLALELGLRVVGRLLRRRPGVERRRTA